MANQQSDKEKWSLRREIRPKLSAMTPADLAARSVQVAEGLAAWLADSESLGPIAIFSALPGEPKLTLLFCMAAIF